jgi:hypothetical protein
MLTSRPLWCPPLVGPPPAGMSTVMRVSVLMRAAATTRGR